METVLITGGTGLVGTALTKMLIRHGYKIIILSRDAKKANAKNELGAAVQYASWNVEKNTMDERAVASADYIIHLAGAGVVDKKWTVAYKQEIIDSRVNSSKLLMHTLGHIEHKVKAFISASAIGWYGADNNQSIQNGFEETAPPDPGFLGNTCQLWEESTMPLLAMGIRRVCLRTGIVLSKSGGALAEFKKPLKLGVAAILGNGKQIISWIHIYDLCRMYEFAISHQQLQGSYNAVAPKAVTNKQLNTVLAKALKDSWYIALRVPNFILKLMIGERSVEVLKSTHVSAQKILKTQFSFSYPAIDDAIGALIK